MSTPEGVMKRKIRDLLNTYNIFPASKAGSPEATTASGWVFMPVQSAYAVKGVPDFLGHYHGKFFAIEAKRPRVNPSGFQLLQIEAIRASGGVVFVVDGPEGLRVFEEWLKGVKG